MPNYRRWYVPGGTYFFTVVTHLRRPILTTDLARPILNRAVRNEMTRAPFDLTAVVLLPDHLHAIWTLLDGDADYSTRWKKIKEEFTRSYLACGGEEAPVSASRTGRQERGVWQPRFWEHVVRDEDDFKRCLDYVHWNPVKHGVVSRVKDYPWSSFRRYVELGEYDLEWGGEVEVKNLSGAEWE
jgi:putative transposase